MSFLLNPGLGKPVETVTPKGVNPMKALLLYPEFPQSFWSYDRFMEIAGLKATIPPLGIITVAALLPQNWEIRFYDRNVNPETKADWEWCELVILSAMVVQKSDFHPTRTHSDSI
jgi:hypothetical protein